MRVQACVCVCERMRLCARSCGGACVYANRVCQCVCVGVCVFVRAILIRSYFLAQGHCLAVGGPAWHPRRRLPEAQISVQALAGIQLYVDGSFFR